jgi:hypothetical protein
MKTMKNHSSFAMSALSLLAVTALLAAVGLVTACSGPDLAPGYQIPDGKGVLKLSFNNQVQRTILPDDADINTFKFFSMEIIGRGLVNPGTPPTFNQYFTLAELATPFTINTGDYTLTIIGYLDVPTPAFGLATMPAAAADYDFTITPGLNDLGQITLTAIDPEEEDEKGFFEYSITSTVPALTSATMTITSISGGGSTVPITSFTPLDNPATWENSTNLEELTEGYYYVDFTLTVASTTVTRNFRHILHIYRYLTSKFEYEFTANMFVVVASARVTPTPNFEIPDYSPELVPAVGAGGIGTEASPLLLSLAPTPPPPATASVTIDVANYATVADNTGYTSIAWYYDGTLLASNPGASLTINAGTAPFDVAGTYQLSVIGFIGDAGYNSELFIKITP